MRVPSYTCRGPRATLPRSLLGTLVAGCSSLIPQLFGISPLLRHRAPAGPTRCSTSPASRSRCSPSARAPRASLAPSALSRSAPSARWVAHSGVRGFKRAHGARACTLTRARAHTPIALDRCPPTAQCCPPGWYADAATSKCQICEGPRREARAGRVARVRTRPRSHACHSVCTRCTMSALRPCPLGPWGFYNDKLGATACTVRTRRCPCLSTVRSLASVCHAPASSRAAQCLYLPPRCHKTTAAVPGGRVHAAGRLFGLHEGARRARSRWLAGHAPASPLIFLGACKPPARATHAHQCPSGFHAMRERSFKCDFMGFKLPSG